MDNPRSWSRGQQFAIPPILPPMLSTRVVHECAELPSDGGEPVPERALSFEYSGCKIGVDDRLEPHWLEVFPWPKLTKLQIDPVQVEEAGRSRFIPFTARRSKPLCHLTLYLDEGTRIFQVAMDPDQLSDHLAPVTSWLEQHREQLQAVAS